MNVQRHLVRTASLFLAQVLINFTFSVWIGIPLTIATVLTQIYGLLRMTSTKESMIEVIKENFDVIATGSLMNILFLIMCQIGVYFMHHRYLVAIHDAAILHDEIKLILKNLDEAIICKTNQGISFCNDLGWDILQNVVAFLKQFDEEDDGQEGMQESKVMKWLLPESLLKNGYLSKSLFYNGCLSASVTQKNSSQM